MKPFTVQINDKDGKHFRKYTKDTLQMLFDTSPSAANFEMMIVVEGLVYMAVRSFYIITKQENEYNKFIADRKNSTFYHAIEKIYLLGIIDEDLKVKLHYFRQLRNDIAHDLFQIKSIFTDKVPKFKDYSHTKSLKDLFQVGLDVFVSLGSIITPGVPNQEEYLKRLSGYYQIKNKTTEE